MIVQLLTLAYLIGSAAYHRWKDKPDTAKTKPQEVNLPRTDEGAPVTLIYGRCRVRQPVLAWAGTPSVDTTGPGLYRMDLFFVVGIPFPGGTCGFHNVWVGDAKLQIDAQPAFTVATVSSSALSTASGSFIGDRYEWYDGNAAQEHVNSGGVAVTTFGARMLSSGRSADVIPGYRGYLSVLLHTLLGSWYVGGQPSLDAYSFEVSSYQAAADYPITGTYGQIGSDANPINVLWDLLKTKFGKLGLPTTVLDPLSFGIAAVRVYTEGLGYSRAIENAGDGSSYITEILEHVDGVIYEDPADGLLKIKLIRNDYNPATLIEINKTNCIDLVNYNISPAGVPNAVRVVYTDRSTDYQDNSEVAKNPANAVGQSNQVRWLVKRFPGVTTGAQAYKMAVRELAAECRIIEKCRALVDRTFKDITPGDVVKVTWTGPDIAGRVFRVAAVDRGTLDNPTIGLDLISDYFYTSQSLPPPAIPEPGRETKS